MNNINKFDQLAEVYTISRPGYPEHLMEYLYEQGGFTSDSVIADVGSGTGKFSAQLLKRGNLVYGVEPNEDMRKTAEWELRQYQNFRSVNGTSEDTMLPADSVDFVTAAQAFHWFDTNKFKLECKRILKAGGKAVLLWNTRDMNSAVNIANFEIFKKYCVDFKGFSGGFEYNDIKIRLFFDDHYEIVAFDHPLFFNKDKFIARCSSASYSLKEADHNYGEYRKELELLFDQNSINGILKIPNETIAYIGTIKA
jgi:SAM-dependent methyltransferase